MKKYLLKRTHFFLNIKAFPQLILELKTILKILMVLSSIFHGRAIFQSPWTNQIEEFA
jgi:hypothetical protein